MNDINKRTRSYRWIHNGFRRFYPVLARILRLKLWEGAAWNRWTTLRFSGRTVLLTDDGFKMIVRPNHLTDLTAVFGRPEEEVVGRVIKDLRPGGVFIDAGAHIGRYTLKAAGAVGVSGKVIAFEPNQENADLLRENCNLNGFQWVEIEKAALGAEDGMITLYHGEDGATNTVLASWYDVFQPDNDAQSIRKSEIPIRRLQSFVKDKGLERIDLLKVDVEGAEMLLFEGAEELFIKKVIKSIICEVHGPVVTIAEVENFFKKYGYRTKVSSSGEVYIESTES